MFEILFYEDERGKSPTRDFMQSLVNKTDKDSRIKLKKIREYIGVLREMGKQSGEPYIKHITGDIWELRPLRYRILFSFRDGRLIILLHCFIKKTQKTPRREIEQAERNLSAYKKREENNG
jgi:phage-related protein